MSIVVWWVIPSRTSFSHKGMYKCIRLWAKGNSKQLRLWS